MQVMGWPVNLQDKCYVEWAREISLHFLCETGRPNPFFCGPNVGRAKVGLADMHCHPYLIHEINKFYKFKINY